MNGTCKLCGNSGLLKESHIIPDFYIRGLEYDSPTGSKGIQQPFSILLSTDSNLKGGAKQRGYWEKVVGLKEYLLCGDCEQKFSEYEAYARNLFYGNASPLTKIPIGNLVRVHHAGSFIDIRKATVDYKSLKLFQLSILWRAGVAKGSFFKEVNLGKFHETKLQTLLRTENPGLALDYPCTMVDLQYGRKLEGWFEQPTKSKREGQPNYRFILGGYVYLFTVSKQKPRVSAQECCVKPNGEIVILIEDETKILRGWANALRKAGRL